MNNNDSMENPDPYRPLRLFSYFVVLNTLVLIGIGGLVTSKGAGMAVPDWPTTYGYNMFFFPISQWKGGIFYEHTHRLFASWVGLLTLGLGGWLWVAAKGRDRWMRWLGVLAIVLVSVQGLLGGLRVVWLKDQIGIIHGALAQSFLVLLATVSLLLTPLWRRLPSRVLEGRWGRVLGVMTVLVFVQLLLGASMRHQHAGLAVPDFPLAYGQVWPKTDVETLAAINMKRADKEVTAGQIHLHMTHRLMAYFLVGAMAVLAWRSWRGLKTQGGWGEALHRGILTWLALILVQATLGAATVWTDKAADIATFHVLVGAINLVWGSLLAWVGLRLEGRKVLDGAGETKVAEGRVLEPSARLPEIQPSLRPSVSRKITPTST